MSMYGLKDTVTRALTEMNVPGRNTVLTTASVFMAELSFLDVLAISTDAFESSLLMRLSRCESMV